MQCEAWLIRRVRLSSFLIYATKPATGESGNWGNKMIKRLLLIFIPNLALHSTIATGVYSESSISQEDYAVYSALINKMFIKDDIKFVVIQDQTQIYYLSHQSPDERTNYIIKGLSPVSGSTLRSFFERNKQQIKLSGHFKLKTPYIILAKQEIEDFFKPRIEVEDPLHKAWEEFYRKYPDSPGFIMLSRVGFDAEKKQALVYIGHACGGLCGQGRYVVLTKEEGNWEIKNELPLWVS